MSYLRRPSSARILLYEIFPIFEKFRLLGLLESYQGLNNQETIIPTLVYNGSTYETNCDKADILIRYVHQCFNKDVPALYPEPSILDPALFPQEYLCTEDEVYNLIAELDGSKSTGQDGISVKMLKATITAVTSSLTTLFNLSLRT
jgi:hypothetical protein